MSCCFPLEWLAQLRNNVKTSSALEADAKCSMHLLAKRAALVRNTVRSLEDARKLVEANSWTAPSGVPRVAVYPGSFNPPSKVHVEIVKKILELPDVDVLWMDMTLHKGKKLYVAEVVADRCRMAELAVAHLERVGVTVLQAEMGEAGWGVEYFETVRQLVGCGGGAHLTWIMGSDVVFNMHYWAAKAKVLLQQCAQIVIFQRDHSSDEIVDAIETVMGKNRTELEQCGFRITVLQVDDNLAFISSSLIRRYLVSLLQLLPRSVLRYILNHDRLTDFYISLYNDVDVHDAIECGTDMLSKVKSQKFRDDE